jgi:SAM-dependent MidA family methyltransferase
MEIILSKINEETVKGCCDCKHNEKVLYEKMKIYIKEQLTSLEESLLANFGAIDTNVQKVFNDYLNDMVTNLEFIVSNMCKDSLTPSQYTKQIDQYMDELHELERQVKEKCDEVCEEILKCENVCDKLKKQMNMI